ncbi:MAG: hypothetical protein M3O50_01130 [Myxococcota bacterium]|nr:hypothetical protein [Myxococcota bacterium]
MRTRSFAVLLALLGCAHPRTPPAAAAEPSTTSQANEPCTGSPVALRAQGAVEAEDARVRGTVVIGKIASPEGFDAEGAIRSLKPELIACYESAGAMTRPPRLKLTLRIEVNEAGAVVRTEVEPGGAAEDPALVACLGSAVAHTQFPKPGGRATIVAPLAFRSKAISR